MATRGTILITNKPFRFAEAKKTKTLLKSIADDNETKFIYNHYDSGDTLTETLKEIISTKSFKHYWQFSDLETIQTNILVWLINKYNEEKSKYDNLEINHDGVHITDNYYVDSEYIYWFDVYNRKLRKYETHWNIMNGASAMEWDIDCLKLMETIDIPVEKVSCYNFDD